MAKAPSPAAPAQKTQASTQPQPGLFSQMAATAGGVAAGSVIGHGISSLLFGSGSDVQQVEAQAPVQQQQQKSEFTSNCERLAKGL